MGSWRCGIRSVKTLKFCGSAIETVHLRTTMSELYSSVAL